MQKLFKIREKLYENFLYNLHIKIVLFSILFFYSIEYCLKSLFLKKQNYFDKIFSDIEKGLEKGAEIFH